MGYWPDGAVSSPGNGVPDYAKPWSDADQSAPLSFWNAREQWYPTWNPDGNNGEDAAFKVDYIKVTEWVP